MRTAQGPGRTSSVSRLSAFDIRAQRTMGHSRSSGREMERRKSRSKSAEVSALRGWGQRFGRLERVLAYRRAFGSLKSIVGSPFVVVRRLRRPGSAGGDAQRGVADAQGLEGRDSGSEIREVWSRGVGVSKVQVHRVRGTRANPNLVDDLGADRKSLTLDSTARGRSRPVRLQFCFNQARLNISDTQ